MNFLSRYPWLDAVYFELKLYDTSEHRHWCRMPNPAILENFAEQLADGGPATTGEASAGSSAVRFACAVAEQCRGADANCSH